MVKQRQTHATTTKDKKERCHSLARVTGLELRQLFSTEERQQETETGYCFQRSRLQTGMGSGVMGQYLLFTRGEGDMHSCIESSTMRAQ